ncbi:conserved Plasmodium protein, unknown function [Plasmodium gallinaceum]|uniref:Uncharacterized protein n=1 Tax=Plasmodium gallinaceum TaxID=5849 RepID=A0A1J1GVP0_PLAGA|nr:conserved Plasmodium protein, unknown function [Plasmodium gallinaceum]CRG96525.1 conserved Plasmodium protein, unknown function [Plasmodium gallinaceum]
MKVYYKKRKSKNRRKCDKKKSVDNINDDKNVKDKSENDAEINNNDEGKNTIKNLYQENLGNNKSQQLNTDKTEKEKQNEYYMYEELKINKDIRNNIYFYTWFYYFENMMLKLDNFLCSLLNYSYYLLNKVNNNKRNILLTNSHFNVKIKNVDYNNCSLNINNCSYKNIEQIFIHKRNVINNKTESKERNIIKFLQKQNIKSMIYINDFFDPDNMSILFLVNSTDENENSNYSQRNYSEKEFIDKRINKSEFNEYNILKGYDIILLRHSFEIFYFYKEKNEHINDDFIRQGSTDNIENEKDIIKNDTNENMKTDNQAKKESKNQEKILEKKKFHTMLTWKRYLKDTYILKENVALDALNICSGMDGYIDDKNFNFDVLLNDEYSYLVQYKTKISICRLIYAVTSLLKKKIKPIIYIPHWWYHEVEICKDNIVESPEFHFYIFNELKKDGLLKVGYKQINSLIFTMNDKDFDFFINLAIKNDAILCTNNNDIIKYYFNINENAKVSKFISKGTFFVLTNFL